MFSPFDPASILPKNLMDKFVELMDPSKSVFSFKGTINTAESWKKLLSDDTMLSLNWDSCMLFYQREKEAKTIHRFPASSLSFDVHADDAISGLHAICKELKGSIPMEGYTLIVPKFDMVKKFNFARQMRGLPLEVKSSYHPDYGFVSGTFEVLNKFLQVVQRYLDRNRVILWVRTDSKEVIGKLVNACLQCKDHRGYRVHCFKNNPRHDYYSRIHGRQ
jgi:hypothetical protein